MTAFHLPQALASTICLEKVVKFVHGGHEEKWSPILAAQEGTPKSRAMEAYLDSVHENLNQG